MDHDANLHEFLERCEQSNLVLNSDKLRLHLKEVPFIGHNISSEGLKSLPDKIKAVVDTPPPTDVQGVRRFIGMVQYLVKFLPQLSTTTAPLRMLLQTKGHFSLEFKSAERFRQNQASYDATSSATVLYSVVWTMKSPSNATRARTVWELFYYSVDSQWRLHHVLCRQLKQGMLN